MSRFIVLLICFVPFARADQSQPIYGHGAAYQMINLAQQNGVSLPVRFFNYTYSHFNATTGEYDFSIHGTNPDQDVYSGKVKNSDIVTATAAIDVLLDNCEKEGKMKDVTVPAGTFSSCEVDKVQGTMRTETYYSRSLPARFVRTWQSDADWVSDFQLSWYPH